MATNRLEQAKTEENGQSAAGKAAPAAASGGGGKSMMPLILNIVLMPAIAYALTTFVLIPKIQGGKAAPEEAESHGGGGGESHGAPSSGSHSSKSKILVPLGGKVLVNVAGTAGTRYLIANITLVGKKADFKPKVEEHDPELRDAAASILSGKTINDLEKPGMRNVIRAELISAFNDILGKEACSEIFLTEFAIQ